MSSVWAALGRALPSVEERPRLAPDIESAAYNTRSGSPYVVIHNAAAVTYARLDPREYELLSLMDGRHSVKELVIAYYQQNGVLALARVAGLVELLRQQDFLIGATDVYRALTVRLRGGQPRPGNRGELTTSALDGPLGNAHRVWGHHFFSRTWLVIGLALGLVGPLLVVVEMARGRYALYEVGGSAAITIVLLVVLALAALALHELGHGLAVKHAGRRVHHAGVRLYFGLPAAYVDTTDVWMAPPRQRIVTAFAGPWTGLVVGGAFAIGATAMGGTIGAFLFTAAFVFLVDNLFNFNPLLELDGYYMLIDFLDQPLLRPRAMAFVRGPFWARLWRRQPLSLEERLQAAFGLGAVAYSILTVVVAVRAWQALLAPIVVDNLLSGDRVRQLLGIVIFAAILAPMVWALVILARRAFEPVAAWLARINGRAAEHRHREALAALRAVPLFADLPAARLLEIARVMRSEHVRSGDEVVRQGAPGERFYLIARGAFEVLVDDRPRSRLGRGDFFGERALLHRAPRAATVVATAPGQVFALDRTDFDALLATDLSVRSRIEAALAYRDEVADMPLFQDLSAGELDVVLARLIPLSVSAGDVVIHQGEPGERFYVIRSGEVEVEREGQTLARLGRGDAFGEIALLLNVPRTATVRAVVDSTLLALEARDFHDLLAGYLGRAGALERLSHLRLWSHKRLDEVVQGG